MEIVHLTPDQTGGRNTCQSRNLLPKLRPRHLSLTCHVPNAGFTIDQQIQACIYQIGHICWRDNHVLRRKDNAISSEFSEGLDREVVFVPWAEECACADDESGGQHRQDTSFGLNFAL